MLDPGQLTTAQRRIVLAPDGPLAVVAGPGSGKTSVLAARVAELVGRRGADPATVLALAFSTGAARELRSRLVGVLGEPGRRVEVATLHAWGLRFVRRWATALGYPAGPLAVLDADDAVLREAAEAVGLRVGAERAGDLRRALEHHRVDGGAAADPRLARLADAYEAALRRRRAIDFAGMLALPLRLLEQDPAVRRLHQQEHRHVLADEGQDLSGAQQRLLALLAGRHRSLLIAGDHFQCLYAWRGADGRFVERLRRAFPEAAALELSECFRASGRLVALANAVGGPLGPRRLWTRNPPGAPARLHAAGDEDAEAAFVARAIARLVGSGAVRGPGEVGVLYRTNRQADAVALALRAAGVPCRVRGPGDPLHRREVRDALAYLRLARDPDDAVALARVVDTPPRGLARLSERLRRDPVPLGRVRAEAVRHGPAVAAAVARLAALIAELHAAHQRAPPAALLVLALERSGYRSWLAAQPDGAARLARLDRLAAALAGRGSDAPWGFDEPDPGDVADDAGAVLLSSIHLAKGSEWPAVFLVGADDGLLPHARALRAGTADALAGERRLAYVAVTRAREALWVTHRRASDAGDGGRPSRFLVALPPGLLAPDGWAA